MKEREKIQVVNIFIEVKLSKIPKVKVFIYNTVLYNLKRHFYNIYTHFLYVKKYHFKTKMRNNYMKWFCLRVKTHVFHFFKMCFLKNIPASQISVPSNIIILELI